MKPIKLYAGLFLVFFLGALAGGLGMGMYQKHQRASFFEERQGKHLKFVLERLTEDLDLTQEQQIRIKSILEDFRKNMMNLQKKHFPEIDALFKEHRVQISKVLNEEQRRKFEEIEKRMMRRPPPGPPGKGGPKPPPGDRPEFSGDRPQPPRDGMQPPGDRPKPPRGGFQPPGDGPQPPDGGPQPPLEDAQEPEDQPDAPPASEE
ncbi:hypothetical protein [Desulfatibacillum aliphaticivorans]|uniref:hypothetical protein n=1 Tax=Desulfatibacillum aliphaticivorans TaxID=218208 RepID=UPI0004079084|nr:hypothetical protein [Desulfatibacillum aliphaticivorans]